MFPEAGSCWHSESDKNKSTKFEFERGEVTYDGNEEDSDYQLTGYLQDLNGLGEWDLLVAVWDGDIEEVNDDHEHQEHADVEDDDVDVPC